MLGRLCHSLVLSVSMLGAWGSAGASDASYKGKQLTMIIGFTPGGSYDSYARIVAQYLPQFLDGAPPIIPKNMPGATSFIAANFLFSQAPKDGTTLGNIGQALPLQEVFKQPGITFKTAEFQWIGRLNSAVEMTISRKTDTVGSFEVARLRELVIGATTPQSTSVVLPRLMNRVVGSKFKMVQGYGGFSNLFLAMERGEVDGGHTDVTNLATMRPGWLKANNAVVLVQYASMRHPAFPEVPTMVELSGNERDRELLSLYGSMTEIGYSFLTPPGTPPAYVAALRSAFERMVEDPGFQKDMKARKVDISYLPGTELQQRVQRIIGVDPELARRAANEWGE